ncbi:phage tail protein, partial [Salmonella sp. zj-f60]|nr:phage tail protein [Salmonella sp. zj-f60]
PPPPPPSHTHAWAHIRACGLGLECRRVLFSSNSATDSTSTTEAATPSAVKFGRASWRDRVLLIVYIAGVAVSVFPGGGGGG